MTRTDRGIRAAAWLLSRPALLFLLWSLWLAVDYFGLGPLSYVSMHDNGDSNLPARLALHLSSSGAWFDLWNPIAVSGIDRIAIGYLSELDNVLFSVLPGWLAYGIWMWIQRFVAGYFTFRLLRDNLAVDPFPSMIAGLIYALFPQDAINHQWAGFTIYDGLTLPGLPLYLWALGRLTRRKLDGMACLMTAGLGVAHAVTSHYSYGVFVFPLLLFWSSVIAPVSGRSWLLLALFGLSWLVGESPTLWASYVNAPLSQRYGWSAHPLSATNLSETWLLHLSLVRGLISDNLAPLGLSVFGVFLSRGANRITVSLLAGLAACLAYTALYPFLLYGIAPYLGVLSGFGFDRLYLLVPFLTATAAALSLHSIPALRMTLETEAKHRLMIPLGMMLGLLAILFVGVQSLAVKWQVLHEMGEGRDFTTIYRHPAIMELANRKGQGQPFRVVTVADQNPGHSVHPPAAVWAYGLESADGNINLFPARYQGFWEQVLQPLIGRDRHLYANFHYRATQVYLFSPSESFLCHQDIDAGQFYNLNLLSLANVQYIIAPKPLTGKQLRPVAQGLLQQQKAWQERPRRDQFLGRLLGEHPGVPLYVYENTMAFPRFFLASKLNVYDQPAEVLSAMGKADSSELRVTAYACKGELPALSEPLREQKGGTVELTTYSPGRIVLNIHALSDTVLVATNNYSPFWKAHVNGVEKQVFPVNHTFQGLFIPRGNHEIVLTYEPPYALQGFQRRFPGRAS